MLPVNEIFLTVQGEGVFTGHPSVFVRLQGCGVGCPWCDTKHTWDVKRENAIPVLDMLHKAKETEKFAWLEPFAIVHQCDVLSAGATHVVITGGEPCTFDLTELVNLLHVAGYTVQVETSGTQPIKAARAHVTLSPKYNMPGGYKVRQDAYHRANEIKHPVGKAADVEELRQHLRTEIPSRQIPVYLQPLSQNPKATEVCIKLATAYGYRVSIQLHKYIGVR